MKSSGRSARSTRAKFAAGSIERKIAYARLNSVQDFLDHPQLEARNRWRMIESPVGPVRALPPPAIPDGLDVAMDPIP